MITINSNSDYLLLYPPSDKINVFITNLCCYELIVIGLCTIHRLMIARLSITREDSSKNNIFENQFWTKNV